MKNGRRWTVFQDTSSPHILHHLYSCCISILRGTHYAPRHKWDYAVVFFDPYVETGGRPERVAAIEGMKLDLQGLSCPPRTMIFTRPIGGWSVNMEFFVSVAARSLTNAVIFMSPTEDFSLRQSIHLISTPRSCLLSTVRVCEHNYIVYNTTTYNIQTSLSLRSGLWHRHNSNCYWKRIYSFSTSTIVSQSPAR